MNQFFYLALSFFASRNSDIEGTGEKVSNKYFSWNKQVSSILKSNF